MTPKNFFLRNIWYYGLPGTRLKRGKILAKTLLGEPILFGRRQDGRVFALRDICPHRAIPLSCGRFDGTEVECCYHGWRFDGEGNCTAIPALVEGQTLDLKRFGVQSYPVKEVQGNIWIYIPDATHPQEPNVDVPRVAEFGDRPYQFLMTINFPCFVDHAVVGLMDPAHSPFVHRAWWWRTEGNFQEQARLFIPSLYGFTMARHKIDIVTPMYRFLAGGRVPETEISFRLPGVRIEELRSGNAIITNLTAVTPLTERETEVNFVAYWTMPWLTPLVPLLRPFAKAFLNQDRRVVIQQQAGLQYDPPLMLINDADTQAKWYYQAKHEFFRAVVEGRQFENPVKERVLRWRG
ncbi:MAG: aromatic ring-hydroxylating dioxygenase subunit alpha [Cyanobacteria bacterium SBLK]|nr:aromatic ring-hydroxylating dioxygenase subunit alpha [Cyanobacteria bacterium SBLK]